jgi:hypothetical protein
MAPNAIDAKAAERCAANADAKQKGNEAASLPRPSNRCRLSPSPQEATLGTPTACAASALRGPKRGEFGEARLCLWVDRAH